MADKFAAYKEMVEKALEAHPFKGPAPLVEAMRYSLLGGGKRLRGVLTLLFAEAVGGCAMDALPCAKALEMIHAYSLIHDDLPAMDNDSMRRGKPSCHVAYGEARAILAGDALLTEAFACMGELKDPFRGDITVLLAECAGSAGMVGGQELDLNGVSATEEELLTLDALKTGALIRCACLGGAILGGGTREQRAAAEEYARHLGAAFQMVDDLLDAEGDEKTLGKTVGKDADAGKTTYYSLLGRDGLRDRVARETALAAEAVKGLENENELRALAEGMARRNK